MRKEIEIAVTEEILRQLEALPGETDIRKLLRHQAGLTKREIRQAKFREDGIRKNGIRCRVTEKIQPQDLVKVCLEEEQTASDHLECFQGDGQMLPQVIYEDEDLLVVVKPAGLVTHPAGGHYRDTLANLVQSYLLKKGEPGRIRPIGRLDRETSGGMVFARNQAAAARLGEQRKTGEFRKVYTALVFGELPLHSGGRICRPMGPDPENRLRMRVDAEGKPAVTWWRTEGFGGGISLVKLQLETGRTHQIRVHMAWAGHPLLGDQLYGSDGRAADQAAAQGLGRAALHAGYLCLSQPFTGEILEFWIPLPEDMERLCRACIPHFNNISGGSLIS